jgi:hypothetical protein
MGFEGHNKWVHIDEIMETQQQTINITPKKKHGDGQSKENLLV